MSHVEQAVRAVKELYRRQCDGLSLFRAISPEMPGADSTWPDQVGVVKSKAKEVLSTGGNQSGKSTVLAPCVAGAARDKPVTLWDGTQVDMRMDWQKGRPLLIWCVGLQLNHLTTMYNMLFGFGLYKIIQDEVTGLWRQWQPWRKSDVERFKETRPSWPLIPPEEVESISWYNKASRQFEIIKLKNGTEIWGLASTSDYPKQGDKVDLIWVDEQIDNPAHYNEWLMRTAANRGRIFWSAYMSESNEALMQVVEAAEENREQVERGEKEHPDVEMFTFRYSSNPFIPEESKRQILERLSPEEIERRDLGLDSRGRTLIYPFFSRVTHAAIPYDENLDDKIALILRSNNGVPPPDWTHELVLDPGTVKPAVILGAVPPPDLWGGPEPVLIVYREVYDGRMTAEQLARKVHSVLPSGVWLNRMIIDGQAGRQTSLGRGETTAAYYSSEFAKFDITCRQTASGFIPSIPDFSVRRMKVDRALQQNSSGRARLRIVIENCKELAKQMETNRLATMKGTIFEKEASHQKDDLRQCLEYWVALDPVYVPQPARDSSWKAKLDQVAEYFRMIHGRGEPQQKGVHIGPKVA